MKVKCIENTVTATTSMKKGKEYKVNFAEAKRLVTAKKCEFINKEDAKLDETTAAALKKAR